MLTNQQYPRRQTWGCTAAQKTEQDGELELLSGGDKGPLSEGGIHLWTSGSLVDPGKFRI